MHWLRENGFPSARRSVQYCGRTADACDVLVDELPNLYIEVKSRKTRPSTNDIVDWLATAYANCGGRKPVLLLYVIRAREPELYARDSWLGGIIEFLTRKPETLIRLNKET